MPLSQPQNTSSSPTQTQVARDTWGGGGPHQEVAAPFFGVVLCNFLTPALTLRPIHFSSTLLRLKRHSSPERVTQKVLPSVPPPPQATPQKTLSWSPPSSPERPSSGTVSLTCGQSSKA